METTESLVARNVAALRADSRLTVRDLAEVLEGLGHRILPSGITKLENQKRSVSVADLVALALALNTTPNRILLPVDLAPDEEFELTPEVKTRQQWAWSWALSETPLVANNATRLRAAMAPQIVYDEFRRRSLPFVDRLLEEHPAVRATSFLRERLAVLVQWREHLEHEPPFRPAAPRTPEADAAAAAAKGPDRQPRPIEDTLRALDRLRSEIDELIADINDKLTNGPHWQPPGSGD